MCAIVAKVKDNSKITEFVAPQVDKIAATHSLAEAVEACHNFAHPGDTVLLSPYFASFDLFKRYEDRGTQFKDAVRAIKSSSDN